MADLASITARANILKEPLVIDLTGIESGKKIEYILSAETIEKFKEEDKKETNKYMNELKKELSKSGVKIQNLNVEQIAIKYLQKFGEEQASDKAIKKVFKSAEKYLFSFDVGVSQEELKDFFNNLSEEHGEMLYKQFVNKCYDEYIYKLRIAMGK